MEHPHPPVMRLDALKSEVLDKGPSAALPCHLSDHWLNCVADSLEQVLEVKTSESGQYLAGPLALVAHLLLGRSSLSEFEVSDTLLYKYLRTYYIEVSIEILNRRTNVRIKSATLQTIFTDRKLTSVFVQ